MAKKKKTVNVGIFGLRRGLSFVKAFKRIEGVNIVAVCEYDDSYIEKSREFLPENTLIFKNFDEFIDSGLDAVVLANFFHEHAKYAIIALEKKIHVLSETTAAPTLGECVSLCRAVEKSKCKYMLAANTPWMPGVKELQRLYKDGEIGKVMYAEAEYLHPNDTADGFINRDKDQYKHWRKHMPRTYYNMHSLGALMEITGTIPVKVSGKAVFAPEYSEALSLPYVGDVSALIMSEMDNGALFVSTGVSKLGPMSKWFRLAGEKGNIETLRFDQTGVRVDYIKYAIPDGDESKQSRSYYPPTAGSCGIFTDEEIAYANLGEASKSGHAGHCDFWMTLLFVKYLRGEAEPFFDVYKATALSAAAILSWRSIQNKGIEYTMPDFTDKRGRRKYENDFLTPFPDEEGNATVVCSSKDYNLFKKYNI